MILNVISMIAAAAGCFALGASIGYRRGRIRGYRAGRIATYDEKEFLPLLQTIHRYVDLMREQFTYVLYRCGADALDGVSCSEQGYVFADRVIRMLWSRTVGEADRAYHELKEKRDALVTYVNKEEPFL